MARAHPVTLGECLRMPALPASRVGRDEAEHLPEGEVPRHDRQHGAERLVADPAAGAAGHDVLVGQRLRRGLGVVLAHPGALLDLGDRLGDRLAHLGGGEGAELGGAARGGLGGREQHVGAVVDVGVRGPRRAARRRPARARRRCRRWTWRRSGRAPLPVAGSMVMIWSAIDGPAFRGRGSCRRGSRKATPAKSGGDRLAVRRVATRGEGSMRSRPSSLAGGTTVACRAVAEAGSCSCRARRAGGAGARRLAGSAGRRGCRRTGRAAGC